LSIDLAEMSLTEGIMYRVSKWTVTILSVSLVSSFSPYLDIHWTNPVNDSEAVSVRVNFADVKVAAGTPVTDQQSLISFIESAAPKTLVIDDVSNSLVSIAIR
jgi:hypothetical protein